MAENTATSTSTSTSTDSSSSKTTRAKNRQIGTVVEAADGTDITRPDGTRTVLHSTEYVLDVEGAHVVGDDTYNVPPAN